MFSNFVIYNGFIDVSSFEEEIQQHSNNWLVNQSRQKTIPVQKYTENIILVNGVIYGKPSQDKLNESQIYAKTELYKDYPKLTNWLENNFSGLARITIVKLKPLAIVEPHVDVGSYYEKRDRYHLVIAGKYEYTVGNEKIIAVPGMLFCFNNQLTHSSKNILNEDRISVIFDVERNERI